MKRMLLGYGLSVFLGMVLGLGVASNKFLEETVGGLLVSLQSLPSICWLPLAVLWFGLTEKAIRSWWSWARCSRSLSRWKPGGSRCPRFSAWPDEPGRPGFKLFLVCIAARQLALHRLRPEAGLGVCLAVTDFRRDDLREPGVWSMLMMGRDLNDMSQVIAVMILIIAIGYIVDGLVFKTIERRLQHKWGLALGT